MPPLIPQVIAAPTGSGKTVILELALLRLLSTCINDKGQFSYSRGSLRAVYLAPSKALVQVIVKVYALGHMFLRVANSMVEC